MASSRSPLLTEASLWSWTDLVGFLFPLAFHRPTAAPPHPTPPRSTLGINTDVLSSLSKCNAFEQYIRSPPEEQDRHASGPYSRAIPQRDERLFDRFS
ncbi:hypothetical protein BS47DRAFT_808621 [Hydnum rufescens UP504]|uniref:Uncharacterized protein n=1 Tax=Hydnum rufescens UP504 TaxID=1448309 RepID=A0A9P6DXX7_9AGAM|nr:hypothetical protein BS47DRAFT_808621 [Hydnum rufescens UP504]